MILISELFNVIFGNNVFSLLASLAPRRSKLLINIFDLSRIRVSEVLLIIISSTYTYLVYKLLNRLIFISLIGVRNNVLFSLSLSCMFFTKMLGWKPFHSIFIDSIFAFTS